MTDMRCRHISAACDPNTIREAVKLPELRRSHHPDRRCRARAEAQLQASRRRGRCVRPAVNHSIPANSCHSGGGQLTSREVTTPATAEEDRADSGQDQAHHRCGRRFPAGVWLRRPIRYKGARMREWRNGRRSRLKIDRRKAWGFKSPLSHHYRSLRAQRVSEACVRGESRVTKPSGPQRPAFLSDSLLSYRSNIS